MNEKNKRLAQILTYSGTFPLILCCIGLYFNVDFIDLKRIASTYAILIISFLSGLHWATYLFFSEKCPQNLLITSNVIALLAWGSFYIAQHTLAFSLQLACFLCILILDSNLKNAGVLPLWFYKLRRNATLILSLVFIIIILKMHGKIS